MNEDLGTTLIENEVRQNSTHSIKSWALKLFPKIINAPYGKQRMTAIILRGSLILVSVLTVLLLASSLIVHDIKIARIAIGVFFIAYLIAAEIFVKYKKYLTAAWMLILLFGFIASAVLLLWSLNTPIGILTVSFTVLLAGILLGSNHIISVTFVAILVIFLVQYAHSLGAITPDLTAFSKQSHLMDVFAYSTIIGTFALVSWLSSKQTEHSINRALKAEEKIKTEKINLVQKLEEQSTALRQTQLQDMANLYRFASIGQSTTAILHELSNQLSILNLDINDLQLRHRQSKTIHNAKEGIENINLLVRQARRQLQENRELIRFNAIPIIERTLKEIQPKLSSKSVLLRKNIQKRTSFQLLGDPSNLSHVITILLNNAFDACVSNNTAVIDFTVKQTTEELEISIIDNGHGFNLDNDNLFVPHKSAKPNGLGIGLYITKQIIESQFKGKIHAKQPPTGAEFVVSLPVAPVGT